MKLNANATFIKIPLAQIKETGNVRHEYDEDGIKELAESIRNNGLMNPITVKPAQEDENGEKTYELIAGHRRIRAYKYLCDQGDDFSMVECCIRTGNKLVLQIIENIQRADITPREKEDAIAQMLAENYSQADIARELSKPIQWVSDIVAGAKVRKVADYHGFDTENIATKTLSQLRTIPEDELYAPLEQLVMRGGTMKAATDILHEWKKEFVHANDKNSAQHLKVCKVSKINDDCFKYIDGDRCCGEYSSSRKKYIDSEVCEHNDWIYEIPDDAVAVKVPDMQPVKTEPDNTQSKGVKNPISKQIQTRWQVFCRSKKIAESEKTAFAFYQELVHFFEDTYED